MTQGLNRTQIINEIASAIKKAKDCNLELLDKNSGNLFLVKIEVHKEEYFIDKAGVKWKRIREPTEIK